MSFNQNPLFPVTNHFNIVLFFFLREPSGGVGCRCSGVFPPELYIFIHHPRCKMDRDSETDGPWKPKKRRERGSVFASAAMMARSLNYSLIGNHRVASSRCPFAVPSATSRRNLPLINDSNRSPSHLQKPTSGSLDIRTFKKNLPI